MPESMQELPSKQEANMSGVQRILDVSEIRGPSSYELYSSLIHASEGDSVAEHQLMRALIPPLIIFFTRRLRIERDDLDGLVRDTIERARTETDSRDAGKLFGRRLFGLARRTMLEHLDRQARFAVPNNDEETVGSEQSVLAPRPHDIHSPHPRFWE